MLTRWDSVVLKIYFESQRFELHKGLNCKPLAYYVVTYPSRLLGLKPYASWHSGLSNYIASKRFIVQTLLWPMKFVIQNKPWSNTLLQFEVWLFLECSLDLGITTDSLQCLNKYINNWCPLCFFIIITIFYRNYLLLTIYSF